MKSLQHINPHTQEYVARLRDERPLEELAGSIQAYYDRSGSTETAATVALLRIEHMYYKHDSIAEAVRDAQAFRAAWGSRDDVHAASRKATAGVDCREDAPGFLLGARCAFVTIMRHGQVPEGAVWLRLRSWRRPLPDARVTVPRGPPRAARPLPRRSRLVIDVSSPGGGPRR